MAADRMPIKAEAVDGFLDRGEFHLPGLIPVFHHTVVFEKGNIIGRGFNA